MAVSRCDSDHMHRLRSQGLGHADRGDGGSTGNAMPALLKGESDAQSLGIHGGILARCGRMARLR
jgi:hypothetical protein